MLNNKFNFKYIIIFVILVIALIPLLFYLKKIIASTSKKSNVLFNQDVISMVNPSYKSSDNSISTEIDIENSQNNTVDNTNSDSKNKIKDNTIASSSQSHSSYSDSANSKTTKEEILTVNGIEKSFNANLMSKFNIACLLGLDIPSNALIDDVQNIDKYISNHPLQTGIYIADIQLPNTFSNRTIIQNCLKELNPNFLIDSNGYIISNDENDEISTSINNIINGKKTIMIGTLPHYYTYINDYDNQIHLSSLLSPYVILEEYNNIIAIIINDNEINGDLLLSALENLC